MKTIAIIEGFSGGPRGTKAFRRELDKAGFNVIKNRRKADIIFAHSAGSYNIPANTKAKLVVLVGVPYWPEERLRHRFVRNVKAMRSHQVSTYGWVYYFKRKLVELYYALTRPKIFWLAITRHEDLEFIDALRAKVIIIRNQDDIYCSPEIKKFLNKKVKYIELPGHHDDFVDNPEPYVDLLLKEL